jgi:hypothetical protein
MIGAPSARNILLSAVVLRAVVNFKGMMSRQS